MSGRAVSVHAGKNAPGPRDAAWHLGRAVGLEGATADQARLDLAIHSLRRSAPTLSAGLPLVPWQRAFFAGLLVAVLAGAAIAPRATLSVLMAALTLPFFCVVALRSLALWFATCPPPADLRSSRWTNAADFEWPSYSVLVPLLREAHVVPGLVEALGALDYPEDRLEILFVVEATDPTTRAAVEEAHLAPWMRLVVVPDAAPRTKPKAVNYALAEATGDLVVVYDAEDIPEPDQLRRAACAFAEALETSSKDIGCLQARLNVYNGGSSWLARQFTIEYTALFDCILPTLEALGLPVPLGGTSNHFRRSVLVASGGWDPFNVTEDADLGIRLARGGWRVGVLPSTTWEEAPVRFDIWLRQRTRWLKGWMQTFLVHTREPRRLLSELGPAGFTGFMVLMGGMCLSALVHPWFFVLAAADAASGGLLAAPDTLVGRGIWWLGVFNLAAGYLTGAALGVMAVRRRGRLDMARHVVLMPVYWLLISIAAYRALWQLAVAPHLWEKTEHAARTPGAV